MSSACTVPRLVRCRVRDLASCFYACRLPLVDEEPEISQSKRPQTTRGRQKKSSGDQISVNIGKKESKEEDDDVIRRGESTVQSSSRNNILIKADDGSMAEPRFAEEDYIVFCFRDDGEIHMVNDAAAKSSSSLAYDDNDGYGDGDGNDDGDDDDENDHHRHAKKPNTLRNVMTRQGEWPPDDEEEIKEKENSVEEEPNPNGSKMESFESCDSNLSDTSTTSFAFPVLGIEWIGSPVHMPKSEKHDAQSVRLHCCRF